MVGSLPAKAHLWGGPLFCFLRSSGWKLGRLTRTKWKKRRFLVCRIALLPVSTPGKHEGVKAKAGEVRSDYGNLWNARSPRGGDPERLLLKDKHPLLTLYIQTTPYLIALICILSRDVSQMLSWLPCPRLQSHTFDTNVGSPWKLTRKSQFIWLNPFTCSIYKNQLVAASNPLSLIQDLHPST